MLLSYMPVGIMGCKVSNVTVEKLKVDKLIPFEVVKLHFHIKLLYQNVSHKVVCSAHLE